METKYFSPSFLSHNNIYLYIPPDFCIPLFLSPYSPPPSHSSTQVVLQVVITFIVDAFALQLEQNNKPKKTKICEREIQQIDDSDSIEGRYTYIQAPNPSLLRCLPASFPPSLLPSLPPLPSSLLPSFPPFIASSTDEKRKKEVRITLLPEDIKKLKYEITYLNETQRLSKRFSFDRLIRRWRRISLEKLPENVSCQSLARHS